MEMPLSPANIEQLPISRPKGIKTYGLGVAGFAGVYVEVNSDVMDFSGICEWEHHFEFIIGG